MRTNEEIKTDFIIKEYHFEVLELQKMVLYEQIQNDENQLKKLKTNLTKVFDRELDTYVNQKRNIKIVQMGETRGGKSLSDLSIMNKICFKKGTNFKDNILSIVCGNQVEYRQKLQNAKFNDSFLIDENFFSNSGIGSLTEMQQLADSNRVIAKMNITTIFILPDQFLNVNANIGLETYGRDNKNWLSQLLLYRFRKNIPYLLGYIVINVGELFQNYGCFIYRQLGGCVNSNNLKKDDLNEEYLKISDCIPKEYDKDKLINDGSACPFYNICNHPICKYEHKKDDWIKKDMVGGIDERRKERLKLALIMILEQEPLFDEEEKIICLYGELKPKVNRIKSFISYKLPQFTNTRMTTTEQDEIINYVQAMIKNIDMLCDTLNIVNNEKLINSFMKIDINNILKNSLEKSKTTNKDEIRQKYNITE